MQPNMISDFLILVLPEQSCPRPVDHRGMSIAKLSRATMRWPNQLNQEQKQQHLRWNALFHPPHNTPGRPDNFFHMSDGV